MSDLSILEELAAIDRIASVRSDLVAAFGESCQRHGVSFEEAQDAAMWFARAAQRWSEFPNPDPASSE